MPCPVEYAGECWKCAGVEHCLKIVNDTGVQFIKKTITKRRLAKVDDITLRRLYSIFQLEPDSKCIGRNRYVKILASILKQSP